MGPLEAIKTGFRKYFDFKGRARRSEFWWFVAFVNVAPIILGVLDVFVFPSAGVPPDLSGNRYVKFLVSAGTPWLFGSPLANIFNFLIILPSLSVTVRRLHDRGNSGWILLLPIGLLIAIPFVIAFAMNLALSGQLGGSVSSVLYACYGVFLIALVLVLYGVLLDGDKGSNKYGPSPKYGGEADAFN